MKTKVCATRRDQYRTIDGPFDRPLSTEYLDVLRLARGVDHDKERVRDWYLTVKIHELGGKTAQELVRMGEADLVIGFLRSIRRGYRD
jgi:hypothetical protein